MNKLAKDRFGAHQLWASIASTLAGLTLAACILLGLGFLPVAGAAAAASVQTAVADYLVSMPGDYYAIGSVAALKDLIASQNPLLIDVRSPKEYQQGHIPAAINLPLNTLEQHLKTLSTEQDIVVYCSTGYRSAMAVMALRLQGFEHVKGFPPGFAGWTAAQR
uniref:rhodanese-like domain-containing protein n=1 Tax=Synechococcus sp. CS-1329 TaxID=2847975 RepID=UPI00223B3667|nr:rhodanese-like domain-containing protein [Synechococcus sp. CS-1329]